ncbi:MAG TPA: P-loop NTPase [Polyangia bacterium]|nr:P-loop NTPase [Polyangia bacterium]
MSDRSSVRGVVGRVRLMGSSRWRPPLERKKAPKLIAVGGAGPGVGKSVVASNLAIALAGLGPHVVLVDLDLAAARQQALFGVKRPLPGVQAWLDGKIETLEASLSATGIRNLHLVTGATPGAAALSVDRHQALVRELAQVDGDVVVVDLGSRNRDDLLDFFAKGALRVLVAGPDLAGLETTYAFLRAATLRAEARYGEGAREALARFRGRLVGNNAGGPEEIESFHAFSRLVREHLGIPVPVLGCVRGSDRVAQSVAAQRPLLARRGLDENVRAFHAMAESLMAEGITSDEACDLGGDAAPAIAPEPLPVDLRSYARMHPRYSVDWAARLVLGERETAVRVRDVSFTGAAVEIFARLTAGDRGRLCLDQVQGAPSLDVVVRNVVPGARRVGLSFEAPGEVTARLVAAASALVTATSRRRDEPPKRPPPSSSTPTSSAA